MFTQTDTTTFVVVSQDAEEVVTLGRKHHWRFRIIPDFQGPINRPVFNSAGDWVYIPKRPEDEVIIPKAAFRRHAVVAQKGKRIAQVVIGHEIKVAPEMPTTIPVEPKREIVTAPKREIDWGNVAEVAAKGVLVGIAGIAMVSLYALAGAVSMVDPSYCIVLDDGVGTVVELMTWNTEV